MKFGDGIDWNAEGRRAAAADDARPAGRIGGSEAVDRMTRLQPPPGRILDAGCNIGRFCPILTAAGYQYTGVDQAEEALRTARERNPDASFLHRFLWEMTFAEDFDVALCNAVLQHNTHAEKRRILPRIAAALRPGGLFVMQESTVLRETATQLTQAGWIALVEEHGFQLLETWHPNNEHQIDDAYAFRKVV